MSEKVAVVTGANKGIGFGIVRGLCKRFNGTVYLTSRDLARGKQAVAALEKEGLHPKYHQLDVTDTKSVEAFRNYIKNTYGGIDVLVNNAAIAYKGDSKEPVAVQAEQTCRVNFFSLLDTCNVLFPILRQGARVVNVSSAVGHLSFIPSQAIRDRFKDPNLTVDGLSALVQEYVDAAKNGADFKETFGLSSYAVSKVAVVALTKIQNRMLKDRDIKVNAVHPGYVSTDMTSFKGRWTIEQGASAPLYLALDAPDSLRGEYVWEDGKVCSWVDDYRGVKK